MVLLDRLTPEKNVFPSLATPGWKGGTAGDPNPVEHRTNMDVSVKEEVKREAGHLERTIIKMWVKISCIKRRGLSPHC